MDAHVVGVMIPIILGTGLFAMIFGIVYLHKRENMAMIERGMNPRLAKKPRSSGFNTHTLTWGLLLIGAGLGLFLAYTLDVFAFRSRASEDGNPAIYFALIAFFGGLGLFAAYRIEKYDAMKMEERYKATDEITE
jgi:hypothetical protein